MSNRNIDNVIDTSGYLLKKLGVKFTDSFFSETVRSHPYYPSLAVVSDVFLDYNIENEAIRVSYDDLLNIETPFMAHLTFKDGVFIVIEKVTEVEVSFYFERKSLRLLKKEDFLKTWDNIVFIAKTTPKSVEPDFKKHRQKELLEKLKIPALVSVVVLSFLSMLLLKPTTADYLPLFLAKIIGLFYAILLVKQELGYHSEIADKLCTLSKSAGCNEVLHSKGSKLFGKLPFADMGLVWFMTSILYLFFFSMSSMELPSLNLLGWIALFSIPMILFSISYQLFVVKKYCPLCLGVMGILVVELLLLFFFYGFRFQLPHISELLLMFILLCLTSFIWFEWKQLTVKNKNLQHSEINYFRLRRNPAVIQSLLMESQKIGTATLPNPIFLTSKQSKVVLTEVINLYCKPCKTAFEKIKKLLSNSCNDTLDVNVILLCNTDNPENEMTKTALHFIALSEQQPVHQVKIALFDWFNLLDYKLWSEKYPATVNENHLEILKSHSNWCKNNNIEGTPTSFFNHQKIPHSIDLEDLQYLINE